MAVSTLRSCRRFADLARLGEIVFHAGDLANLWHITNKNTLYTTIKRYVQQGLLFRLYKGFYAIKRPSEIDRLLLGLKALHDYGYVSAETILREYGVIQQELAADTLISNQTRHFVLAGSHYYVRRLPDQILHQSVGIVDYGNGVRKATPERAVADLLYFNQRAYFDAPQLLDWQKVRSIQQELGYPLTPKRYV